MAKYGNRKIIREGMRFDSVKEHSRYMDLTLMQRAGIISDLQRQVTFELIPSQKVDGKVVERPCSYIADFVYKKDGEMVVEDVKSPATRTTSYTIKRKLMLWIHGIRIREV